MMCLFADLSLLFARRLPLNQSTSTTWKPAAPALGLAPNFRVNVLERSAIPYRDCKSNPIAAVSARSIANPLLRASHRCRNLMRPTR
jgi:hypothetical protein